MSFLRQTGLVVAVLGAMVCHEAAAVPISDIPWDWEAVSSDVDADDVAWVGFKCFNYVVECNQIKS